MFRWKQILLGQFVVSPKIQDFKYLWSHFTSQSYLNAFINTIKY